MKAVKYPYGLFISAMIVFILGAIHDDLFIPKHIPLHIPTPFIASIYSFKLLLLGLLHSVIYNFFPSGASISKLSRIVYWYSILLVAIIVLFFILKCFGMYLYSFDGDMFKLLFFLYIFCHFVLFTWLIVDRMLLAIKGFNSR